MAVAAIKWKNENGGEVTFHIHEGSKVVGFLKTEFRVEGRDVYLKLNGDWVKAFSLTEAAEGKEKKFIEEQLKKGYVVKEDINPFSSQTMVYKSEEGTAYTLRLPSLEDRKKIYTMSFLNSYALKKNANNIIIDNIIDRDEIPTPEKDNRRKERTTTTTPFKKSEKQPTKKEKVVKSKSVVKMEVYYKNKPKKFGFIRVGSDQSVLIKFTDPKRNVVGFVNIKKKGTVVDIKGVKLGDNGVVEIEFTHTPKIGGKETYLLYYYSNTGDIVISDKNGNDVTAEFIKFFEKGGGIGQPSLGDYDKIGEDKVKKLPEDISKAYAREVGVPLGR